MGLYKEGEQMNKKLEEFTHQKYDKSLEDIMDMYDNQPYTKDPDLCSSDKIKLFSGNVMKYYTFQVNRVEPYLVQNQDEAVKERIEEMKRVQTQRMQLAQDEAAAAVEEEMDDIPDVSTEATVEV